MLPWLDPVPTSSDSSSTEIPRWQTNLKFSQICSSSRVFWNLKLARFFQSF
jgi:hypothetical protein